MATFIKGNAIENAVGYQLSKKVDENYNCIASYICGNNYKCFTAGAKLTSDGMLRSNTDWVNELVTDFILVDHLANNENNMCALVHPDSSDSSRVVIAFYKTNAENTFITGATYNEWLNSVGVTAEDVKLTAESAGAKYVRFSSPKNETYPCYVCFTNEILFPLDDLKLDIDVGTHKLVVNAIGEGDADLDSDGTIYQDSDYSNEVTYQMTRIKFTINGVSYQAEDDMTWSEWCKSDYNTGGYKINGSNCLVSSDDILVEHNYSSLLASASPSAGVSYMTADVTTLTITNSNNNSESVTFFVPIDITFQNLVRSEYDTTNGALTLRASDNRVCYNNKPLYTQTGSDFANTYNTNVANGTFYYSDAIN